MLTPCHCVVAGSRAPTKRISRFSSYSSSSPPPPRGQLDRGVDEEEPEDVEDPAEVVDRRRTDRDEDPAHHQGEHDADQERLLLQLLRYAEPGHDDQEDEQVVDRERVLGQPAGEELGAVAVARDRPHADAEGDRHPDVHAERDADLLAGGLVRAAADHDDVEEQDGGGDAMVSHQASGVTCRVLRSRTPLQDDWLRRDGPEVSSAGTVENRLGADRRPRVRTVPDRDDEIVAKEYSPPTPVIVPDARPFARIPAGSVAVMSTSDIAFYFDPVCPFAWMTSKWVRRVRALRGYSVEWRFISLRHAQRRGRLRRAVPARVRGRAHRRSAAAAGGRPGARAEHGPEGVDALLRRLRRSTSSTPRHRRRPSPRPARHPRVRRGDPRHRRAADRPRRGARRVRPGRRDPGGDRRGARADRQGRRHADHLLPPTRRGGLLRAGDQPAALRRGRRAPVGPRGRAGRASPASPSSSAACASGRSCAASASRSTRWASPRTGRRAAGGRRRERGRGRRH